MAYFRERGSVLQGTSKGTCERFEVDLMIDSDESEEEIACLMRLAHKMCFTESVLKEKVTLHYHNSLNGKLIQIGESDSK